MERLRTEIKAQGWIRRAQAQGLMATVVRRGDADAGALFLKLNRFKDGCEVLAGTYAPDGAPAWFKATGPEPVAEKEADAYLARQAGYDSDLWVVEIEDPKGQFRFDDPVIKV